MKNLLTICAVAFGMFLTSCTTSTQETGTAATTDTTVVVVDSVTTTVVDSSIEVSTESTETVTK